MGGLFLLLILSVVMALASFLAGALPLSMTLSQSQLRLISSIGVGILVGTALIVIIPEGVEAVATTASTGDVQGLRSRSMFAARQTPEILLTRNIHAIGTREASSNDVGAALRRALETREDAPPPAQEEPPVEPPKEGADEHEHEDFPTFYIGLSLMLGFVLMFLIDRLPQHATDGLNRTPATRHISLDDLGASSVNGEEEDDSFLGSLTPTPKQSRSLATTTGLVIHAAADGIAMGASATTSDMKLGLIIFIAIMFHKAPAAFGLTSLLLRQGLSKRAARGHLIAFSLAAPFGALGTFLILSILGGGGMEGPSGQWWTGMLLLFSAGTFLYVAMHAMQEDQSHDHHDHHSMNGYADNGPQRKPGRPQMRDTLATVGGMLLPLLTQFGHHH
ncbi:unnamed protein product [Discula destructiva]